MNQSITTESAENTERDKLTHAVIGCAYKLDFVVEKQLILELKSVARHEPIFEAQLLTYMKLAHIQKGLLISFNSRWLKDGVKRMVLS